MEIPIEKVGDLEKKGDQILFKTTGEEALVQLFKIQEQVEEAIKNVKTRIEAKALELDPNFKAVIGDKVKVGYRYFGQRYFLDQSKVDKVPQNMLVKVTKYNLDLKELDKWTETHKNLPEGIKENERLKQITIKIKGYDE